MLVLKEKSFLQKLSVTIDLVNFGQNRNRKENSIGQTLLCIYNDAKTTLNSSKGASYDELDP